MKKQAFSSEKYLNLQRDHILERINQFDGKLYLEFGGKMLEDFHAARVLPGYEPDNKIKLLQELRDQVEIVIAINANNIEHSRPFPQAVGKKWHRLLPPLPNQGLPNGYGPHHFS